MPCLQVNLKVYDPGMCQKTDRETYRETLKWQGREIATSVTGTGPSLILCHGTPFSSSVWDPVVAHLGDVFEVYRWDMPGYGASSRGERVPVDLDSQSKVLKMLIDHWGLDRPAAVGHDIAGAVTTRAHLVHGVDYSRLLLLDAVVVQPWGSPFWNLAQEHSEVFMQLPANMHEALLGQYLTGATLRDLTVDEQAQIAGSWIGAEGQAAFYRQIRDVHRRHTDDLEPLLGQMRCETVVAWGVEDVWLPIGTGRRLAELLGIELIEIADSGHLVQYDQPERLANLLTDIAGSRG